MVLIGKLEPQFRSLIVTCGDEKMMNHLKIEHEKLEIDNDHVLQDIMCLVLMTLT